MREGYRGPLSALDFEKKITAVPHIRSMGANPLNRESKVRKATDGEGYEYYCSASGGFVGLVNVAIFVHVLPLDTHFWMPPPLACELSSAT